MPFSLIRICGRVVIDRVALASFAAHLHAKFVHLLAERRGEGENAADALVDEIFRGAD